jgi:hypothetical protein
MIIRFNKYEFGLIKRALSCLRAGPYIYTGGCTYGWAGGRVGVGGGGGGEGGGEEG